MTLNKPKIFRDIDTINASLAEKGNHINEGLININNYNLSGDGVTNDKTKIQNAISGALFNQIVTLKHGTYNITEITYTNSSITLTNRSFDGQNSKLLAISGTGSYISDYSNKTSNGKTITADIVYGSNTITLEDVIGFSIGDIVFCRLGDNPFDNIETNYHLTAKIISINGNTITIDKNIMKSLTVLTTTVNNKKAYLVNNPSKNNVIKNVQMLADENSNIEGGIVLKLAEDYEIKNIVAENCGAGMVELAYCTNIKISNVHSKRCNAPNSQGSKGRAFNFWNCRNILVENAVVDSCQGVVAFIESYCENIKFRNLIVNDTRTDKIVTEIFAIVQGSNVYFEDVILNLQGNSIISTSGGTPGNIQFKNLQINNIGTFFKGGLDTKCLSGVFKTNYPAVSTDTVYSFDMSNRKTFEVDALLTDNMYTGFACPQGLLCGYDIYLTGGATATDVTGLYIGTTNHNGLDIRTNITGSSYSVNSIGLGTDYSTRPDEAIHILITATGKTGLTGSGKIIKFRLVYAPLISAS